MKKTFLLIVCVLSLLTATLSLLSMQSTAEEGKEIFREPIYIRSDGTIDPERARELIQIGDDVYTLEVDIVFQACPNGFVIEKSGIVLDLNGHELSFEEVTAEPGPLIGVTLVGISGVTVTKCKNVSGFQYGIYLRDSNGVHILNNTVFYNDIGIYSQDSSNVILESNKLTENTEEGIYIWHSNNHTVVNNDVSSHDICGVLIFDCENNSVVRNTVSNNVEGIAIRFSKGNAVEENLVSNNTEFGISVTDNSHDNTIIHNTVTLNNGAGIFLKNSNKTDVLYNNASLNTGNGVELQGSYYSTIHGNTASNNTIGIKLSDTNKSDVTANFLTENSQAAISLHSSAGNTIRTNTLLDNFDGVLLQSCDDNRIQENRIFNSDGHGIRLQEHSGNVESNTIIGNFIFNSSFGISVSNSNDNSIEKNELMHNLGNSIELSNSIRNFIFGNYIQKSGHFGIFLLNSDDNTIRSNAVMTSNSSGINLTDSSGNRIYYNNFIENGAPQAGGNTMAENIWEDRDLVTSHPCPVCDKYDRRKGNYWSDYTGVDDGSSTQAHNCPCDGIGDTPYLDLDDYPLMAPWIPIVGDLDLNGVVDIFDVVLLTINFGSTT